MKKFIIGKMQDGIKLEKFIEIKTEANQAFLFMMIRKKMIKVNGTHAKDLKMLLKENDEVIFYLDDKYFKNDAKLHFDIIYEDENLIIIDKPKKILCHSVNKEDHNNVIDIVTKYLIDKGEFIPSLSDGFRPSVNNRLDMNTSGLLIISKNRKTLELINNLIMTKRIEKHYLAIVKGRMEKESDTYKDYYIKNEHDSLARVYKNKTEGSKEIITDYKVLKEKEDLSLLEINLITGRTHQIRCHMAYHHHPVLGDNKYGDTSLNSAHKINTQELISYKLIFPDDGLGHLEYLKGRTFTSGMKLTYKM